MIPPATCSRSQSAISGPGRRRQLRRKQPPGRAPARSLLSHFRQNATATSSPLWPVQRRSLLSFPVGVDLALTVRQAGADRKQAMIHAIELDLVAALTVKVSKPGSARNPSFDTLHACLTAS